MALVEGHPESILACKDSDGHSLYLVKFVNTSSALAQWLPVERIADTGLVTQYRKRVGLDSASTSSSSSSSSSASLSSAPPPGTAIDGKEEKKDKEPDEIDVHHHDDGDDDSWQQAVKGGGGGGGASTPTPLAPYRFVGDQKEEVVLPAFVAHAATSGAGSGVRISDSLPVAHATLLTEAYLVWRNSPMLAPASSVFRTTAVARLPRTKTKRAQGLALANCKYLLALLASMKYPRHLLSLDFFAFEEVSTMLSFVVERDAMASCRTVVSPGLSTAHCLSRGEASGS
jgi:hypothetical protein